MKPRHSKADETTSLQISPFKFHNLQSAESQFAQYLVKNVQKMKRTRSYELYYIIG